MIHCRNRTFRCSMFVRGALFLTFERMWNMCRCISVVNYSCDVRYFPPRTYCFCSELKLQLKAATVVLLSPPCSRKSPSCTEDKRNTSSYSTILHVVCAESLAVGRQLPPHCWNMCWSQLAGRPWQPHQQHTHTHKCTRTHTHKLQRLSAGILRVLPISDFRTTASPPFKKYVKNSFYIPIGSSIESMHSVVLVFIFTSSFLQRTDITLVLISETGFFCCCFFTE